MKLSTAITLMTLTSAAVATNAIAYDKIEFKQFSLTPYARVVSGISSVNHYYDAGLSSSKTETASNKWGTSYIGLNAEVYLTDDLNGVLNLESGFGTEDGSINDDDSFFNRKANVGISSKTYGTLTAGTHLRISQDITDMDPMSFQDIGLNTLTNGVNDGNATNSVIYRSPELYGFNFGYMHKFGGMVGSSRRASTDGVSLSYQYDNFKARAIYQKHSDDRGRQTGGKFYGLGTEGQWLYVENYVAAVSYQFNDAKVFLGYDHVKASDSGFGQSYTFDDEANVAWTGINYQATKKLSLLGAFYHLKMSYSDKKSNLYAVGLNYDFNKYFKFYTTVGFIDNDTISADIAGNTGVNNHALSYTEYACDNTSNCDGADQLGGYTGFVLQL